MLFVILLRSLINFIWDVIDVIPNGSKETTLFRIYKFPGVTRSNGFLGVINFLRTTFSALVDILSDCLGTNGFYLGRTCTISTSSEVRSEI